MAAVSDADTLALFDGKGPSAPEAFAAIEAASFGVLVSDGDAATTFHDASVAISLTDTAESSTGQFTDAGESIFVNPQGSDTGTFNDAAAVNFPKSDADTGTGTDTQSRLALSSSDALRQPALEANGPGQGVTGKSVTDTDYGSGAEPEPATVNLRDFDTTLDAAHAVTDADAVTALDAGEALARTDADSGALTDAGFPGGRPSDADLFLGAESPELAYPQEPAGNSADTAAAAEASLQPAVPIASADTATGTESAGSALPQVPGTDAATITDAGESLHNTVPGADAVAALDAGEAILATESDADAATFTEAALITVSGGANASDASTGADASSATFHVLAADPDTGTAGPGAENGFIPTLPHSEETGRFTDNQSITAPVADADRGSSIEGYAYDIPLFTHWQDAPGTLALAGLIAPGTGFISALYGVRSATVTPNQSQYTMAGSDTEQGAWSDITDITVSVEEGFLPYQTAATLLGYNVAADQSGMRASLPYLVMHMSQQSPVPIVLRSFSQDHSGNYRTTDIILYAVTFTSFQPSGTASYKEGMAVTWEGRAVRTSTDENGAALPPGSTPAFGRIQSQPGTSYALVLQAGPAVQISPVDQDFIFSDDEESAGASFRDGDLASSLEAAAKGVATAIGPSADTGSGAEGQSVLKGVQFITDSDPRPAATEASKQGPSASDTASAADAGKKAATQFALTGFAGGGPGTAFSISPASYAGGALAAACAYGGVFTSTDQGSHWQPGIISGGGTPLQAAAACAWSLTEFNGGVPALYAMTGGGFCVSLDGGQTWGLRSAIPQASAALTTPPSGAPTANSGSAGRRLIVQDDVNGFIYALTFNGGIQRSSDNGQTWSGAGFGASGTNYGRSMVLDPSSPSTAYVAFYGTGGLWKTSHIQSATSITADYTQLTGAPAHVEDLVALGGSGGGAPGGMGAAVSGSSYGDSNAYTAGVHLSNIVGRNWGSGPPGVARKYIGNQNYGGTDSGLNPVPAGSADPESILLLTSHGIKVVNTFKPAVDLTSTYGVNQVIPSSGGKTFGQERALLANWLSFYQSKGVPPSLLEIILFHECNIHAAIFAAASDYHAYADFYGQTVVDSGYPLDFCSAINAPGSVNLFYPSEHNDWFNQIMTDYYLTDFSPNPNHATLTDVFGSHGQTLSWIDFVDSMGKKPGIGEYGFTNGKTQPTYAQMESWLQNQIIPVFGPRVAAGLPMGDLLWFDYGNTTHGNLIETAADSPSDPNPMPVACVTLLQQLSDAVTTAQGAGSTVLYAAAGPDGIYRSADGGTTWSAINGSGFIDTAQSWWSSIDAWVDPASGQHVIVAACSNPVQPVAGGPWRTVVLMTASPAGTGAVTHADISSGTLSMTSLPPDNRTWWNDPGGDIPNGWPGAKSCANPQIRVAGPAYGDPQYQQLYMTTMDGVFQSPDQGATWSPLLGAASQSFCAAPGAAIAADPLASGHVVCASPVLGSAAISDAQSATPGANASTSVQARYNNQPGLGVAFDPVSSAQYLGVGAAASGGDVATRASDSAAWASTGLAGTPGYAGQPVLGVYAGRDGSNVAFQLAATQGAGLWRKSGSGSWAQRTAACSPMGSVPAGQNLRFAGSGSLIFAFDRQAGVFRSTDYGVTWTQIWAKTAGNECSGDLALNPTVANELWVSADPVSSGSGLFKVSGANTGTVGGGLTAVQQTPGGGGQAGPIAIKAGGTNGTVYATLLGGAGGTCQLQASVNSGTSWQQGADSSFGQFCAVPRDLALAGGRLFAALAGGLMAWGTPSV